MSSSSDNGWRNRIVGFDTIPAGDISEKGNPAAIRFYAQVYKVQTLVDNGIRVTLDLAETETVIMAKLAECQRFGSLLNVTAIPFVTERNNETEKGAERDSTKVGRRRLAKRRDQPASA